MPNIMPTTTQAKTKSKNTFKTEWLGAGELLSIMKALIRIDRHPVERSFQVVLTVVAEQQPQGVQVVERLSLTDHLETEWLAGRTLATTTDHIQLELSQSFVGSL